MASPSAQDRSKRGLGRRRFLTGMGAGVGALALNPVDSAMAAVDAGPSIATSPLRFGRMFPSLPSFAQPTPQVIAAMNEIGKPGGILDAKDDLARGPIDLIVDPLLSVNNKDNPFHTAGVTFLGQFLDHDMTFDTTSRLAVPLDPEAAPNTRTPVLDLDTVYGGGPVASPQLYNPADRAKLRIESGGLFEDLPRLPSGQAIIGDPRNDENLIIAGLHAAFILFHNRAVDRVRGQGVPESNVFAEARKLLTWHYHWIIVNEFLPMVCGHGTIQHILHYGRQYYRPRQGEHFMPVEFQGACYRFGHSMVRPSYRANLAGDNGQPFFGMIFDPSQEGVQDPSDLRGGKRARRRFIGWQTFFNFGDGAVRPNKRIDTRISTPLFRLPLGAIASGDPPTSLPQRNLLRHLTWTLPSGQDIARHIGTPPLTAGIFPELARFGVGLDANTPLWYYTLKEGEHLGDGLTLGPVGGRIVGEVFIGLMQLDTGSYLNRQPNWKPTLPSRTAGKFTMVDFLTYARVDPASRGQ